MNALLDAVLGHAAATPHRVAVDPVSGPPVTYAQIGGLVRQIQHQIAAELVLDRAVALHVDHGLTEVLWEIALLDAGVPVLSLPSFFTPGQIDHALATSGAQAVLTSEGLKPVDWPTVTLPAGSARITFTSGSTGTPRGVCLSARQLLETAAAVVSRVGTENAGRHIALLPPGILLETVAGLFASLLAGGTYVAPRAADAGLAAPFRPDFAALLGTIVQTRATSLILVPELLAGMVAGIQAGCPKPTELAVVAVGGARVSPALLETARSLGIPARQGYGLTECGSVVSLQDADDKQTDNAGRALDHVRMIIADDGEVMISGATCLGAIGGTRPQSPWPTGDIGHIDEAGRLHVSGRKSNLIVTSHGRNIAPEWVEEVLLAQPGIAQCMVHGDGQAHLSALIVPAHPAADLAAAVAAANAALPAYAAVHEWRECAHFLPENGRLTGNGRMRRDMIAAAYLCAEPKFFTQLEADTVRQRIAFLATPQVRAGLAGDISLTTYVDYLTQAYHHVSHTVPLLKTTRARLLHRPDLVAAIDEYIAEETGHEEWILSDIAACGGNAQSARDSAPHSATRAMVDHAYTRIREGNPASFFGMVYVLESISVALASKGAASVAEKLGLPPEAFSYLTSHGALDQSHMRFFENLMNGLRLPDDRAAITEMAREMFGLFGGMFASIRMEALDEAA